MIDGLAAIYVKSVLPKFCTKSFLVSGLTFKSLIHFGLFLCMILGGILVSSFYI